jgi:wyosine [tRNA(Phe)-imidazoG37] synthetase (radical SAM superfamily)
MKYKYIFGPIPSRRFGLSLGVDLVPFKTCSFNCIYCECGRTTNLTLERKEYIDVTDIINELKDFLSNKPEIDFITITGSGEPTLNSGIGRLATFLKTNFGGYKTALLTNGTLLHDSEVVESVKTIDVIKVTLNAVDDPTLCKINKPAESVTMGKIIEGIISLRKNFTNKIWIELFIIPGINDDDDKLLDLKIELIKINPDVVHLNSLDRPGAFQNAVPADHDTLLRVKKILEPLPVEIISKVKNNVSKESDNAEDFILSIIKRRPSTVEDIVISSGLSKKEIEVQINKLKEDHKIIEKKMDRGIFYLIR